MGSNGLFNLIKTITLDMQRSSWPTVAGSFDGFADRHADQMVVLEHQPTTEVAAVVAAFSKLRSPGVVLRVSQIPIRPSAI